MLKVMIAEDEILAREELQDMLREEKDIQLVGSVANGKQLLEQLDELQPDLIFLDIEMPEVRGIEVARQLFERRQAPLVIFTTAYEEYAVEAFAVTAVDYLLKPYDQQRLRQALQRALQLLEQRKLTDGNAAASQKQRLNNMLFEENERLIVVKPQNILYAVRDERMVQVHTTERVIQTRQTLQDLEDKLVGYSFVRSHRSYLVNLEHVAEVETWFNGTYNIILRGDNNTKIPVSRAAAKDVLQRLQHFSNN